MTSTSTLPAFLAHPYNCCQRCGLAFVMDAPAFGEAVPADQLVYTSSGIRVHYVYTHIICPEGA